MFKKTIVSEEEKTCMLIDYPRKINCIKIPQSIDGYKVISAIEMLFCGNQYIEKVILPEGFECITTHLFYNCTNLRTVEMPDTVEEIGICAFLNCQSLSSIKMSKNIKYIGLCAFCGTQISRNRKYFYDNAFYLDNYLIDGASCKGEYKVKDGTTLIADEAFADNHNLKKIILPESLEIIGNDVFRGSGLVEIKAGNNIKTIKSHAFYGTPILGIAFKKSPFFCIGDILVRANPRFLKGDIRIPLGIKKFADYAFEKCNGIESISYPKEIEELSLGLFHNCENLKVINVPKTVKIVNKSCFSNCRKATNLTVYETTTFATNAFSICPSIENVTIIDEKDNPTSFSICNQSLDNILFD